MDRRLISDRLGWGVIMLCFGAVDKILMAHVFIILELDCRITHLVGVLEQNKPKNAERSLLDVLDGGQ